MSKLESLIKQKKAREGSYTFSAITVRVPETLRILIDEIANSLDLSRQEALLTMLEDGVDSALALLNPKQPEATPSSQDNDFHILNTNRAHSDEDQEMMLAEGIAAAFYDPWFKNINRIKRGDWIFLYQNGKGIIAYGQGTGQTLERDHEGNSNACRYQKLTGFTVLKNPMTAQEVKALLDRNVVFLRTMVGVPDGIKLLDSIRTKG